MVRLLSCLFFLALMGVANAQGVKPPETGVGIVYNRETAINLKLTTNRGFAPGLEFGRLRTYYKTTFFHISLGELKHPKEQRQSAEPKSTRAFRPFVFGKQNNFFIARGGWGVKRYYSEKAKHKGVAVGISYSIGPSLGILKPYYLALLYSDPGNINGRIVHEKYSDENAALFLDKLGTGRIQGASPFTKGLGELSLMPGANASLAFHMDWGAFDEFVKALEIGAMLDVFPKAVPILVSEENSPLFLNFFINLQFGKRH